MEPLARPLMIAGLVLLGLGALLYFGPSLGQAVPWLGRLPGDLRIERPGGTLYLPLTTCLLISVVLSAAMWLFGRLR